MFSQRWDAHLDVTVVRAEDAILALRTTQFEGDGDEFV